MANQINEDEIIMVDDRNGIEINEYEGNVSLNAVELGQNGVWYRQWVFRSKWQNGGAVASDKKQPMSVRLGPADGVIAMAVLAVLKGRNPHAAEIAGLTEDEIPF